MRRKLNLDPHELYEMRMQGMTNQQIANSLDVSIATVRKYLHDYPKGLIKQGEGISKLPPAEQIPEVMELRKIVAINGFTFDIFPQEGKVQYNDLLYTVEQIDDLISALKAVRKQFKE